MKTNIKEVFSMMDKLDSSFILNEETMFLLEATRDEIYDVYYDEEHGRAKRIPRQIYNGVCALDNTVGENQVGPFAKWLLNRYGKDDTSLYFELSGWYKSGMPNSRSVTVFRTCFKTFKKLIAIKSKMVNLDINSYDPESFLDKMEEAVENDWDKTKKELVDKNIKLLYEDDEWKVLIPLNYTAEVKYGSCTAWCTVPNENTFNSYTNDGKKLIIIINKKQPITIDGKPLNVNDGNMSSGNRNPKKKYQISVHNNGEIAENERWESCDANDNHFNYKKTFPQHIIDVINKAADEVAVDYNKRFNEMIKTISEIIGDEYSNFRILASTNLDNHSFYALKAINKETMEDKRVLFDEFNRAVVEIPNGFSLSRYFSVSELPGWKRNMFSLEEGHHYLYFSSDNGFIYDETGFKILNYGGITDLDGVYGFFEDIKKIKIDYKTYIFYNQTTQKTISPMFKSAYYMSTEKNTDNWIVIRLRSNKFVIFNKNKKEFIALTKNALIKEYKITNDESESIIVKVSDTSSYIFDKNLNTIMTKRGKPQKYGDITIIGGNGIVASDAKTGQCSIKNPETFEDVTVSNINDDIKIINYYINSRKTAYALITYKGKRYTPFITYNNGKAELLPIGNTVCYHSSPKSCGEYIKEINDTIFFVRKGSYMVAVDASNNFKVLGIKGKHLISNLRPFNTYFENFCLITMKDGTLCFLYYDYYDKKYIMTCVKGMNTSNTVIPEYGYTVYDINYNGKSYYQDEIVELIKQSVGKKQITTSSLTFGYCR